MAKYKIDVNWDDDQSEFDELFKGKDQEQEQEQKKEFVHLVNEEKDDQRHFRVGDKVEGVVSHLSPESNDILIEINQTTTAVIAKADLLSEDQDPSEFNLKVGDKISAFIINCKDDQMILSTSMSHSFAKQHALETAYNGKIPTKGRVLKAKKGGFDIQILGKTAFCPISQIDSSFVEEPETYVGKEFDFIIERMSKNDIVVSRRKLLDIKIKESLERLQSELSESKTYSGIVVEYKSSGVLIALSNGVKGFCPISHLSHSHISKVQDSVQLQQQVDVKVIELSEIDQSNPSRTKLTLSIKEAAVDPWQEHLSSFIVGESYPGEVTRLAPFGAFVLLKHGLEGLIHISQMSWGKRVHSADEVVSVGDQVQVRVLEIDENNNRISLSLKSVEDDPWYQVEAKFPTQSTHHASFSNLNSAGAWFTLKPGLEGFIPLRSLKTAFGDSYRKKVSAQEGLDVRVELLDLEQKKILLSPATLNLESDEKKDYEDYLNKKKINKNSMVSTKQNSLGSFGALLKAKIHKSETSKK